jgi:hypothetical protein
VIRLAWRQFRAQGAVALAVLLVVAAILLATGPRLARLYRAIHVACATGGDCAAADAAFAHTDERLRMWLGVLVVVGPGLIGAFWGGPLIAREFEAGTHRLAWTQSVSRSRWLAVQLATVGLASMAAAGLLSLMVTGWDRPLDRAGRAAGTDVFGWFDARDVVPVGHAAFAFALGAAAGLMIRRTVPAMAASLAAYLTLRIAFVGWWRPGLIGPVHLDLALDPATTGYGASGGPLALFADSNLDPDPPRIPGAWITSVRVVDRDGHGLTGKALAGLCPGIDQPDPGGGGAAGVTHRRAPADAVERMHECVRTVGATYHEAVTYQPAGRYWAFQWIEFSVFLGAALVLCGFCVWRIRRRAS